MCRIAICLGLLLAFATPAQAMPNKTNKDELKNRMPLLRKTPELSPRTRPGPTGRLLREARPAQAAKRPQRANRPQAAAASRREKDTGNPLPWVIATLMLLSGAFWYHQR